jgi:hypothetical protein
MALQLLIGRCIWHFFTDSTFNRWHCSYLLEGAFGIFYGFNFQTDGTGVTYWKVHLAYFTDSTFSRWHCSYLSEGAFGIFYGFNFQQMALQLLIGSCTHKPELTGAQYIHPFGKQEPENMASHPRRLTLFSKVYNLGITFADHLLLQGTAVSTSLTFHQNDGTRTLIQHVYHFTAHLEGPFGAYRGQ